MLSHVIIVSQHVSITPVSIIGVSYSNNTISIHTDNCTKGCDKATWCYTWIITCDWAFSYKCEFFALSNKDKAFFNARIWNCLQFIISYPTPVTLVVGTVKWNIRISNSTAVSSFHLPMFPGRQMFRFTVETQLRNLGCGSLLHVGALCLTCEAPASILCDSFLYVERK